MRNIIEIKNLNKSYGDVKAVDGISFNVREGSLFAFLGLNGAGKSTTINMICSILKKDSGQIIIDGLDLDEHPIEAKSKIGVVFQDLTLDNVLTAKENLSLRAGFYGLKGEEWKNRLAELSELLDLDDLLKKQIRHMSGGQKRRVDIARGLINLPKILVLDEPTTGLDPTTRKKIWQMIDHLRKEKKMTVFLTTHYMEEANQADRVVIIDNGKIVANDTPHNLKNQFSSDYLKVYMPQNVEFEEKFSKEYKKELAYSGEYYKIKIKDAEEVKDILKKFDKYMTDFEVLKGDMDDVFLNITGKHIGEGNEEKK